MKQAIASLKSTAPISFSRCHQTEKLEKENPDAYEKRTWRSRLHVDRNNKVIIPPNMLKNSLDGCAKYLSIQIPGKGKSLYTKHFEAGVMVTDPVVLPITPGDVEGEWLHVPSDGRPGGSKRVWKCFPFIPEWTGDVSYYIFDETITEEVFSYVLEQSGKFQGLGAFRPRNRGYKGRFEIESLIFE